MKLIHCLNLSASLILADGTLPRYIYWEGQGASPRLGGMHALPLNLPMDLMGFGLLSFSGSARLAAGLMGMIDPPPSTTSAAGGAAHDDESVKAFFVRHLGEEAFDRIIDPFVSGIYSGDPAKLSMKAG